MMAINTSEWAVAAMVVCALGASGLAAGRVLRGPTQADRVVALDIFLATAVALCAGAALATGDTAFLDVGLVLALVGFVGTLGWARMLDAAKARESRRTPELRRSAEAGK